MNFDTLRTYLLSKPGAVEDFPFDTVTLVVKVGEDLAVDHRSCGGQWSVGGGALYPCAAQSILAG